MFNPIPVITQPSLLTQKLRALLKTSVERKDYISYQTQLAEVEKLLIGGAQYTLDDRMIVEHLYPEVSPTILQIINAPEIRCTPEQASAAAKLLSEKTGIKWQLNPNLTLSTDWIEEYPTSSPLATIQKIFGYNKLDVWSGSRNVGQGRMYSQTKLTIPVWVIPHILQNDFSFLVQVKQNRQSLFQKISAQEAKEKESREENSFAGQLKAIFKTYQLYRETTNFKPCYVVENYYGNFLPNQHNQSFAGTDNCTLIYYIEDLNVFKTRSEYQAINTLLDNKFDAFLQKFENRFEPNAYQLVIVPNDAKLIVERLKQNPVIIPVVPGVQTQPSFSQKPPLPPRKKNTFQSQTTGVPFFKSGIQSSTAPNNYTPASYKYDNMNQVITISFSTAATAATFFNNFSASCKEFIRLEDATIVINKSNGQVGVYETQDKEVAINFPNKGLRDTFTSLLNLSNNASVHSYELEPGKKDRTRAIYFEQAFFTSALNLSSCR